MYLIDQVRAKVERGEPIVGANTVLSDASISELFGLAGCDYVAPYVNRMENNNIDPYKEIEVMRKFYDTRSLSCEILAASFKNTAQVTKALLAGADTCTIPADIFMSMINKEVATAAIKAFNGHGEQLKTLKDQYYNKN